MCYVHIGHDSKVGNNIALVNNVNLAGHVQVDDFAIISANVGIHQFSRVGAHAFIAHAALVGKDVPPYVMVTGLTGTSAGSSPCGINSEGLKRRGFTAEQIKKIKEAYKVLYRQGLIIKESLPILEEMAKEHPCLEIFHELLKNSKRGILR